MGILRQIICAAAIATSLAFVATPGFAETWTKAEVKAVDTEEAKITLKHEAIADLDMPAMTMVFRATDPAKLVGLAEGDAIEFVAGNENGQMVVKDLKKN